MARDLLSYRRILPEVIAGHLVECVAALRDRQWFAAAVWTPVLLEALLEDFARRHGIGSPSWDDLNGRITQLRELAKRRPEGIPVPPDEILRRCEEIRSIRNRLVHNTGSAKTTLEQDAGSMLAALGVILDWYETTVGPATAPDAAAAPVTPPRPTTARLFISTITPHSLPQEIFLDGLDDRLRAIGIEPVRVILGDYDKRDPLAKVRRVMEGCHGLLAIGLERSHAYFLRDREGSAKQVEETHRRFTSGWLPLEAGVAYGLGLPAFVICERHIANDGLFDRSWNSFTVIELDELSIETPPLISLFSYLESWGNEISAKRAG